MMHPQKVESLIMTSGEETFVYIIKNLNDNVIILIYVIFLQIKLIICISSHDDHICGHVI